MNVPLRKNPIYSRKTLQTEKLQFFYREEGIGNSEVLLLIHGFQSSHYSFSRNLDFLSSYFHVIALDLPGFGYSSKHLDFQYDFENFAHAVDHFLHEKGIRKAYIAGNSVGGGVGISLAALYPSRVKKLILIDPVNPYDPDSLKVFKRLSQRFFHFLFTVVDNIFLSKRIYEKRITANHPFNLKETHRFTAPKWTKNYRKISLKVLRDKGWNNIKKLEEHIPKIQIHTLLLYGELDHVVSPEKGRILAQTIPDCRFEIYPACGHMPQYEVPSRFHASVLNFLI